MQQRVKHPHNLEGHTLAEPHPCMQQQWDATIYGPPVAHEIETVEEVCATDLDTAELSRAFNAATREDLLFTFGVAFLIQTLKEFVW